MFQSGVNEVVFFLRKQPEFNFNGKYRKNDGYHNFYKLNKNSSIFAEKSG
jgi:hypothetical protein